MSLTNLKTFLYTSKLSNLMLMHNLREAIFSSLHCKMSSTSGSHHLEKTSINQRQGIISPAEITNIRNISPTVKELQLHVENQHFYFKAGQWLDMFIPGVDIVGGYSMSSAPHMLTATRELNLAVKFSKYPPAYWIHTQCKIGDRVNIRAGGDFYFNPSEEPEISLLLLAGGVGINPLFSILQQFNHHHMLEANKSKPSPQAAFLYSAQNMDEFIFLDRLKQISNENIDLHLYCTRQKVEKNIDFIKGHRIQESDVTAASSKMDKSKAKVFICGPGSFIKSMESFCFRSGFDKSSIFYETWW